MHRRTKGIFLFAALVACVFCGISWAGTNWPGFRGPNFDGTVPEARLFEGEAAALTLGWKRALGSGYSAIAVDDGRVVTMFADEDADVLAAFDPASGDELWRYRIADTYHGHDGSHDGPISTPLISGDRIYGLGAWGHLFAVDANSGKEIWATHLVDDLGGNKPHYGFTTSPLMADGMLVVEIGGDEGKMIGGIDPDSGELKWTAGDDKIEYHSPIVATIGGRRQVVAAGKDNAYGIDAATGQVLWSYKHEGDERAMGGFTIVPVPAGDDRLFLMNKIDSSVMLSVTKGGDGYEIEELWSNGAIKSSYVVPVYHDGNIYGMSNRIFTCLDATTGDIRWRSREPGDGFPTMVGEHLVIMTKPGSLHVAKASPDGYKELARIDLFEEHSWSEVAYAGGHLYARSMSSLARVDLEAATASVSAEDAWIRDTEFGVFLTEVEQAGDKNAVIEAFLGRHESMPIVESTGAVHFVYRGEAEDVGIIGDMIGFRREDPMTRLDGTDVFYYSTRLEPDAAVTYGFIPDYGDPVADPYNSRKGEGLFGEVSWFAMPAWKAPTFLDDADDSSQGRLETVEWESQVREGQNRTAEVYLPAGYDADGDRRYPVLYVHNGQEALDQGSMKNALDQLIGSSVDAVIGVFIHADEENPRGDLGDAESYAEMIVKELVPKIDGQFRTIVDSTARATIGAGRGGNAALYSAFAHSDVFGRVGAQSATMGAEEMRELATGANEKPMVIYLEWGTYHLRSPHEAWDLGEENRKLWAQLREAGYRPAGGEVPEGYGWACWNGHTDDLLAALYPLRD
jgi:enterochelin esterase-like enzyme/outer membrane protein assembly factor BamB